MSFASVTAKRVLLASGWYARRLRRDTFPGVLVLCYHGLRSRGWRNDEPSFPHLHVDAEIFDGHCRVLKRMCHPIALDDWRAALDDGRPLPPRAALVTFDDGYRSVFDVARPILKRHGIPAVMFVCTQPIRDGRLFSFDAAARGTSDTASSADPLAPLTADQVRTLSNDGFEIGVHTATHVRLSRLSEAEQRAELATCRSGLREWTGCDATALAYPFGKPVADYSEDTVRIAGELEFDFAFTTQPAFAGPYEPPLERSRFLVLSEVTPSELAHRIAYTWPRS